MLYTGWRTFWRFVRRRLFAGLTLVAYVATAVGFPAPVLPAKTAGAPFPCQNHLCGCRSAEECWRHCCCFTAAERWAWARERHVEPPSYAEPPPVRGWSSPRRRDVAGGRASTCPCCAGHETGATSSCCRSGPARSKTTGGGSASALRCRGLASLWVSTGAVLPPPRPLSWSPYLVPAGWLALVDASLPAFVSAPPDRPPRAA